MTRSGRIIAGLAAALLGAAALLALLSPAIADALLTGALRKAGFSDPALSVARLTPGRIVLRDVEAGGGGAAGGLSLSVVDARFDVWTLLRERRVHALEIGPGEVALAITKDGALQIAGFETGQGGARGALPFAALTLEDLAVTAKSDAGVARLRVAGRIDMTEGGALDLTAQSDALRIAALRAESAEGAARVVLAADGTARIEAQATGAASFNDSAADAVAIEAEGTLASWKNLIAGDRQAVDADMRVAFRAGRGTGSDLVSAGEVRVAAKEGALTIDAVDGAPLRFEGAGGALVVAGVGERPLFEARDGLRRLGAALRLEGAPVEGSARLVAVSEDGAPWRIEARAGFDEQTIGAQRIGAADLAAAGTFDGRRIAAAVDLDAEIRTLTIGRLTVADAPVAAALEVEVDLKERMAVARSRDGACVAFDRATLRLAGQDGEMRLADARWCEGAAPLLVQRYGETLLTDAAGRISAPSGQYRIGQTRFAGAPPDVDFAAAYDPKARLTTATGRYEGGRVVINGVLVATKADGAFSARLDATGLSAESALKSAVLSHNAADPVVASVIATGAVALAEEKATFSFDAATPAGAALGKGEGTHDLLSGKGAATFRFAPLRFAPGALQPAALLPGLKGIVGAATGAASGEARFSWARGPKTLRSSARIALVDLAFRGPGVAVSQTKGLNGEIVLSSLAPLATAGEQTVRIGIIDMDALKLENGAIRFELPGDGTLRVREAEFPWFGGRIGAYDAAAPLGSGEMRAALRADNVDLGALLASVNVEGLSGEGRVEGTLPIAVKDGKARIDGGALSAVGPGRLRYTGKAADAASATNENAKLAFDILRDLKFDRLTALIDGPLDGTLQFKVLFEGTSDLPLERGTVASPVIYRINLEAPILNLIESARLATDFKLQLERGGDEPD